MEAYPLQWPLGYKRTSPHHRVRSKFIITADKAQRFLRDEVKRLCGKYNDPKLTVSTNIPVRQDGGLYSAYMDRKLDDPGVAIYFKYKGKDISMCCDQYVTVWENVYALAKGIDALRSMERWGVSDFLDRAFTGFQALPESNHHTKKIENWWEVLGVSEFAKKDEIRKAFIEKAKKAHPDAGGTTEEFQELQKAYETGYFNINNFA